jgi:hypothetical protein
MALIALHLGNDCSGKASLDRDELRVRLPGTAKADRLVTVTPGPYSITGCFAEGLSLCWPYLQRSFGSLGVLVYPFSEQ